ncbi:Uu.00g130330.m01.CDS01 [Anthostomella pinea]|uniref:Uu.00g130330.m01.CDS01 n=1 Tax=Anthostomella pinea TaxID=933095 RepID=A0AAI8YI55_9PEZI|nr:Uu.00g130330.m01.CDS01 [Anthostomella pinea]
MASPSSPVTISVPRSPDSVATSEEIKDEHEPLRQEHLVQIQDTLKRHQNEHLPMAYLADQLRLTEKQRAELVSEYHELSKALSDDLSGIDGRHLTNWPRIQELEISRVTNYPELEKGHVRFYSAILQSEMTIATHRLKAGISQYISAVAYGSTEHKLGGEEYSLRDVEEFLVLLTESLHEEAFHRGYRTVQQPKTGKRAGDSDLDLQGCSKRVKAEADVH